MKVKKVLAIIIFMVFLLIVSINTIAIASSDTAFVWSQNTDDEDTNETVSENTEDNFLNLESESAILIEQSTGKILYEKNAHEQLRPASVTKVMSILLIMEALDGGRITLEDKVPCSEKASGMGGSQIWLEQTEELTVDEMLKAICVVSANDCTVAMAEFLEGREEAFVAKMNERAKELGMNDTTFKNCHGIDEDGHVTSSYDISLMSRELLMNHPTITNYTTIWMDSLRNGESELVSTNKLIRNYKGATGLKTGSTSLALYNLSASATRDDLSLIAVIMRAPTTKLRFSEATKLLDYGFSTYEYKKTASKNDIISTVNIDKGLEKTVNAIASNDCGAFIKRGEASKINQEINLPESVESPVNKGDKLGEIVFKLNDEIISSVDIVAEDSVNKISTWNMVTQCYKKWFYIFRD